MTEEEAKAWIAARFTSEALTKLERFVDLVLAEATKQNLVSAATLPEIWARHIVDSAQLVIHAAERPGSWLDIGTGAGFPGMVAAALGRDVTMVEPRRKRVEFLGRSIAALDLGSRAHIVLGKVESLPTRPFNVISARAVAALPALLAGAVHCSNRETLWLLPKGRNAEAEVADARRTWHGTFHVEHSITDPSSLIVIANGVRRR